MIEVEVTVPSEALERLNDAIRFMAERVVEIVEQDVVRELRSYAKRELAREPGEPQYPLNWKSEKQRIYMLNYAEVERPYQRTHELASSWDIMFGVGGMAVSYGIWTGRPVGTAQMAGLVSAASVRRAIASGEATLSISLANWADYAQFVIGEWQQPFHADTGWPAVAEDSPVLEDIRTLAAYLLEEAWGRVESEMGA